MLRNKGDTMEQNTVMHDENTEVQGGNAKQALKTVSVIAFALTAYLVIASALQVGFAYIAQRFLLNAPLSSDIYMFLVVSVPQYMVAFPIAYLIMRKLPKTQSTAGEIKPKTLLAYCAVSFALMYVGNLIGTGLMAAYDAILGTSTANTAAELVMQTSPLFNAIVVAIMAPIFEELLFRRLIMDRMLPYGELNACVFSALTFALFHGNFFQFFYAFGLGFLFAYIYAKTRNVIYPMIIHTLINLMGSVVSVAVLDLGNDSVTMIYGYVILILLAAGLLIFFKNRRSVTYAAGELSLGKERTKTLYFNASMILFYIVCLCLFAVNLGLIVL